MARRSNERRIRVRGVLRFAEQLTPEEREELRATCKPHDNADDSAVGAAT